MKSANKWVYEHSSEDEENNYDGKSWVYDQEEVKGNKNLDAGFVYSPYIPLNQTEIITDNSINSKMLLKSRYSLKNIG